MSDSIRDSSVGWRKGTLGIPRLPRVCFRQVAHEGGRAQDTLEAVKLSTASGGPGYVARVALGRAVLGAARASERLSLGPL